MRTYNLFISHSWNYSDSYEGLLDLLNKKRDFKYRDYSVPRDNPIHHANSTSQLKNAIENQMRSVSCVLILAGVYASYSKWIDIEIDLAQRLDKKIIAIEYWGSERTSRRVKDAADRIVKWNVDSIVDAIRN